MQGYWWKTHNPVEGKLYTTRLLDAVTIAASTNYYSDSQGASNAGGTGPTIKNCFGALGILLLVKNTGTNTAGLTLFRIETRMFGIITGGIGATGFIAPNGNPSTHGYILSDKVQQSTTDLTTGGIYIVHPITPNTAALTGQGSSNAPGFLLFDEARIVITTPVGAPTWILTVDAYLMVPT